MNRFFLILWLICTSLAYTDEATYEGAVVSVGKDYSKQTTKYYSKIEPLNVLVKNDKIERVSTNNVTFLPNMNLKNPYYNCHFNNLHDFSARFIWSGFDCWYEKKISLIETSPLTHAAWSKFYERSFSWTGDRLGIFGEITPPDVLVNLNSMINFRGVVTDTNKNGEIELIVDPVEQRIHGTIYFGNKMFGPFAFGYQSYSFDQDYETLSQGMNISFGENGSGLRLYFYGQDGSEIGGVLHFEKSDKKNQPDIALFGATVY